MKLRPLKGIPSFFALQAYGKILLGLKMLPMYGGETYLDFFQRIEKMPPEDQEKVIREAVFLVDLERDEVLNLMAFVEDANGVPYTDANAKGLSPDKIHEILVLVCKELARIKPKLLSETEKKK